MADDTAQTPLHDALEERVVAFRQQPEAKGFAQLRQELRDAGRGELLAELCATWASQERDPVRAADAWSEAGEAMAVLGEMATAIEYLRSALDLDPTNDRAADRLLEIVEPNDPAAAVEIIEQELTELAKKAGGTGAKAKAEVTARRGAHHRKAAELWNDHLGRVDRALWHWQQAWKLEPQRTEALEAARQLYISLGDEGMVAKLYQAELEVLGNHKETAGRRSVVRFELGKLALRAKDLEGAAVHLEEAAKLDPTSDDIAEKLAEVYASPGFREGQTRGKAGELFVELGRQRLKTRDDATGINYLRRAVGIDPYSKGSSEALQDALQESSQWQELDRALRHRSAVVSDPGERAAVLRRRAALYRNQLPDRPGLIEVLSDLVAYEQPGSKASHELRGLLRDDQDWEAMSRLMEAEINALAQNPETPAEEIVAEILELATVAREHMGDRDRAAELLHQALGVDPMHEEALARYVDHFRERRDWRGLIELYEFALDNAREAGMPPDELVRRLEEIAQLAELRLGDIDRSLEAWNRIAELEPDSPKVAEAMRRLTARSKMWQQLVASLEHELATANDPIQRISILKKMAQTYRERQIDPRRAIELFEQILAENPGDDATLKALAEMYEKEGDDAGLANSLRRTLDLEEQRVVEAMMRSGKGADAPKEWPVAKRSERLTQLRRLAQLYETRLADVDGVVYASRAVLELLTGDRDALERMERVLEKAGDPRLEQTLEYHAAASGSPAERAKLLKRLAKLATARQDDVAALDRWEQTMKASPSDPDALAALSELYEKFQRWPELAQVIERLDGGRPLPAPGTTEAAMRAVELERYAIVVDMHLQDAPRAVKAWHRVLELTPRNRTALAALVTLYRSATKWRELADVLGSQIVSFSQLVALDDRERACDAAMERAEILEERLGTPAEAIKVLDHLIRELNPNHLEAHTALRRLHEARGDFDAAVRIAEREMYLSPEPERKVARGIEIGMICRDRLNNPTRALQAFKRVLELDADEPEALAATAELLARLGRWKEYVVMLERSLQLLPGRDAPDAENYAEERRTIVQRIAAATADKLADPKGAFRWWRRAHDEAPDEQTLADVRRAAEAYGLWRELAEVLTDERKRLVAVGGTGVPSEPQRYVALSRELAGLAERRLGDKPRAFAVMAEGLAVAPRDGSLLAELDRLAAEIDVRATWKSLLDSYDVALLAAAPAERVELYLRRSKVLDEKLNDPKAAVVEALHAFSWAPDREDTREILVALAGKARSWIEVVAVDSALVERAATAEKRVELLRRKAQVIEEQLKDAPRAFRTHLIALLLQPDDADTASHLWRLARVVGKYRDTDKTPNTEPPSATVQAELAIAEAVALSTRATSGPSPSPGMNSGPSILGPGRPYIPRRLQTEPLADADLGIGDTTDAELNLRVGDSTQPLDLTEIEMASGRKLEVPVGEFVQENRTMALDQSELSKMMIVPPRLPPGAKGPPPPRPAGSPRVAPPRPPSIKGPPMPPPRARSATNAPPLPGAPPMRKAQAVVRRAPLPTLPNRAFESPWEELAVAYESMPVTDAQSRLRWLYRASEVWETGGKDITRAFDALARAFAQARRTPGSDTEVRARLHRIAQEHKAWDRLADLYEGMAEDADTAIAAADLLMEVATIRTEQKKPREAEAQLRRILGMLPNEPVARARIEELYRAEGRWVELAASLEERTDPRLGTAAPESERPQLLRELAQMYVDKLKRPHDAIDAFERLRMLAPADTTVLFQLADLYVSVARWSKVIETLARVGEVSEGSTEARDALRRIALIYVTELELPERALDAYNQISQTWPDDVEAWAALDAIYTTNARWNDLADVLRRRAALERDPALRAQLLSRRAQVLLDWLNNPEEAAATLRHARTIAPDDPALADQLVTALVKAGREREAAGILENRIDAMTSTDPEVPVSRGDLAALHIRLAQIRLERLDDKAGAQLAIDQALALVPEHPTALAVLASVASPDDDPRAFADAKLREADSAKDDDVRIAALMAAGEVLQSRVQDTAGARAAYERVLTQRPYHSDATWALAGLVEKGGDPETAARVLEKRLEDESLTPLEKARIMTQLAALSRAAGVEPAAERRLLEALGCMPDHIPAIVALADFYADAERWTDLEAFLREVLGEHSEPSGDGAPAASAGTLLAAAPAALIADLHRRMANAHEKLGRDEDAFQTLVAADRLHRGHLLIKLALGENRYRARRWREAALHLSPLAGHDDAARYPSEVAQGLYHAALAEIRSLRPEKAPPLYVRALELKPNYAPALQALAEIAMEQGDHTKAADLLTRQATSTEEPAERMRLFEALGDMALMMLHDEERARACFTAAVAAAQPIEAKHVPLLEKLLERQDLAGDHPGAARTAELMAAFGSTPADRCSRYLRAARDYLGAGDRVRARAAADRAVESDPYDIDAVDLASGLAIDQSDVEAAAGMLTRLLTAKDDRTGVGPVQMGRRAMLSFRLGHARHQRGDNRQAQPAYERAIQIAPDSEGATGARRGLVELARASDDPARRESIVGHLQAITAATGALPDLVMWAEELRRTDKPDAGRATLDLAVAAGHTPDVHQNAFLSIHKPYAMRDDESYKANIDATERALLSGTEPAESSLAPIAAALAEAAALLWPDLDEALARGGAAGARRVPATQHTAATAMFSRLTTVLGTGAVMLYQRDAGPDVAVICAATPTIVLGPRLALDSGSSGAPSEVVRAQLARAVELTRPEHVVFAGMPLADATRLLVSVIRLFGPQPLKDAAQALVDDADVQRGHDEMVKAALSVKIRTRLEQVLAQMSLFVLDVRHYLAACERTADRAALLLGGDAKTIVEHALARGSTTQHLISALGQPAWLPLRTKLGVGIR